MVKIIFLITGCCCWHMMSAQSIINKAEYFFNTDPGFGNGINIPLPPAAINLSDISFNANLNLVSNGLNNLFVRARTTDGRWSQTNRYMFVKSGSVANPNISRVEYFLDTDPGFGNGTPLSISPGQNLSDVSGQVEISGVSDGLHSLFIRSRDANNKWSLTNRFLFVKLASEAVQPNITRAEYFIDTDPGFGNAIPVALNPLGDLADIIMNVNITGLAVGDHRLFIRSRDGNGRWSITNVYDFPIGSLVALPQIVVNSITRMVMCGDAQFKLAFHATGTYNVGNAFQVQLSNAAGNFSNPIVIGNLSTTGSGLVNCNIPSSIANGANYRVRVVSTNPVVTGLASDPTFTLYTQPRYNDTTVYIVCQGQTFNLNNIYNTSGFAVSWNTSPASAAPAGNYFMYTKNTELCKDTASVIVKQDVAQWTGTTNKNWHLGSNWSTGRVPTSVTHVIIPTGVLNTCEVSASNAAAASVQIRPGAILTFTNSRQIIIYGTCNPLPISP